ncbi:protease inhibitor I42 family protein [Micromonospora sp. DT81.3]|uniref:protease inhibitor I42 family protein n=1 Tax=Actinomycetes TaxID=1760 RepID=UPI003CFB5A9B
MAEVHLQASDDGGSVAAKVGDHIVIVLEENATTGYRWTIAGATEAVTLASDGYAPSPSGNLPAPGSTAPTDPVMGRGGNREFRLVAVSPGVARVVLALKREWEDDASGIARWTASINVT